MTSEDAQQGLFPEATPPALPVATEAQIAELLTRLKLRRAALVDAYAVGFGCDEPVSVSFLQPLATLQEAIEAVAAELAQGEP